MLQFDKNIIAAPSHTHAFLREIVQIKKIPVFQNTLQRLIPNNDNIDKSNTDDNNNDNDNINDSNKTEIAVIKQKQKKKQPNKINVS